MKKRKQKGIFQFATFSVIGASNALIDIGSFNLLLFIWPTENNQLLLLFNSIAYLLAITNSYFWNVRFTFKRHTMNSMKEKILFILQAFVSLLISNLVFAGSTYLFKVMPIPNWMVNNLGKASAMILSSLASFFMMKYLVFYRKRAKG